MNGIGFAVSKELLLDVDLSVSIDRVGQYKFSLDGRPRRMELAMSKASGTFAAKFPDGVAFSATPVPAMEQPGVKGILAPRGFKKPVVRADGIRVFNALGQPIEKEHSFIDWDVSAAEKGGYAHFMFKEIMEQPEAIRKTISPRIRERRIVFDELKMSPEELRSFNKLYIVACGSSYHVGMVGKYNLERLLRMQVDIALASEFRYADPLVDEKTLVIVISQSGETLDTMAALRKAKSLGARILSIVNVVGSSIARESDDVLYTWAGPEIAVATTKAYSTQLVLLDMFGIYLAELLGRLPPEAYDELISIAAVDTAITEAEQELAQGKQPETARSALAALRRKHFGGV